MISWSEGLKESGLPTASFKLAWNVKFGVYLSGLRGVSFAIEITNVVVSRVARTAESQLRPLVLDNGTTKWRAP